MTVLQRNPRSCSCGTPLPHGGQCLSCANADRSLCVRCEACGQWVQKRGLHQHQTSAACAAAQAMARLTVDGYEPTGPFTSLVKRYRMPCIKGPILYQEEGRRRRVREVLWTKSWCIDLLIFRSAAPISDRRRLETEVLPQVSRYLAAGDERSAERLVTVEILAQ